MDFLRLRSSRYWCIFLLSGLSFGCQFQKVKTPNREIFSTHLEVSEAPELYGRNPTLFVALESHLGKEKGFGVSSPVLLQSAGKPLLLRDLHSQKEYKEVAFFLNWKRIPLDITYNISRQVIGPFASFESAEKIALKLRMLGLQSLIARPNSWQVWLPEGVPIPDGFQSFSWKKKVHSIIKPVINSLNGETTLMGPIKIEAPDGLKWNGGVYRGTFILQPDAYGTWTLIQEVPLEEYLEGVVPHEIGSSSPPAALAAQSVLARTWALANSHRFAVDGYHLCSDTQCQVYKDPRKASAQVRQAIVNTSGNVLSWKGKPIHAVYHASNGGVMASGQEAWDMAPVPYLRAQLDGTKQWIDRFKLPIKNNFAVKELLSSQEGVYGRKHSRFRWVRTLTSAQLQKALLSYVPDFGLPKSVSVIERGVSGRAIALEVVGRKNEPSVVLRLDNIRRTLRQLPSTLFVVEPIAQGIWSFSGGGFGHGAGLSQAGAIDLARNYWTTEEILNHYYPGTIYGPLPD